MPGSRIKYDPGLVGGARTRYTGKDAYASQQRENETRVVEADTGRFFAPTWFDQTAPGALTSWYADFTPLTPDLSAPVLLAPDDHAELGAKFWKGAYLQRFTFTDQSTTATMWFPVISPGWWNLQFGSHVTGTTVTAVTTVLRIVPVSSLNIGNFNNYVRVASRGVSESSTSGTLVGGLTVPLKEECAVLLNYQISAASVPTLVSTNVGVGIGFDSFISGFKIP